MCQWQGGIIYFVDGGPLPSYGNVSMGTVLFDTWFFQYNNKRNDNHYPGAMPGVVVIAYAPVVYFPFVAVSALWIASSISFDSSMFWNTSSSGKNNSNPGVESSSAVASPTLTCSTCPPFA